MSAKLFRSMLPVLVSCIMERNPLQFSSMTELTGGRIGPSRRIDSTTQSVFLVTALGAFMASLDLSIVNVAFPALERSFSHDPPAALAWVITGYSIVFGSLLVIAGRTADRLGSRRGLLRSDWPCSASARALCGLAPSVALLIAGRLVQGCGAAAMLPASLGLLLGGFPTRAPVAGRRAVGWDRRAGRGHRALARSAAHHRLRVALPPSSSTCPSALVAWLVGRRVLAEVDRPTPGTPRRTTSGVVLVIAGARLARAGHLPGTELGLVESAAVVGCFAGAVVLGRSLRAPVVAPPRAGARPDALSGPLLQRGQRRDPALRHGLLRHAARQHPVPHERLALHDPRRRTGGHPGTAGRGVGLRTGRPAGRAASASGRCCSSASSVFAGGLCWFATRVGLAPRLPQPCGCRAPSSSGSESASPSRCSARPRCRACTPSASPWAVPSTRPPARSAGALGIAMLVVILGTPHGALTALDHFRHLWLYAALMAALSGVACTVLRPARVTSVDRSCVATGELALETPT